MTTQHASGPWFAMLEQFKIYNKDRNLVADCGRSQNLTEEENEENVRLIAAAPELLDALKAALPLIDDAVDNMDEQCQVHRDDKKKFERRRGAMESLTMQAAWTREVIAKASGQNAKSEP